MALQIPTLKQLRENNRDYISGKTGGSPLIPNSSVRALSDANAGTAHLILQYIDNLSKQLLPDTATAEWLRQRHAKIWLGGWKQATYASGQVLISGKKGVFIPTGTLMSGNGGNGEIQQYRTSEDVTCGDEPKTTVNVVAIKAGSGGNLTNTARLSLDQAITGVNGIIEVVSIVGGTDEEDDDQLRQRVLDRIRRPPMGGDADDYVAWALQVPGVTRAWCSSNEMGPGTVTVRFLMDDLRADACGLPNADDIDAVKQHLDEVRPVSVKDLFVVAPIFEPLNFSILELEASADSRGTIEESIRTMLRSRAAPARTINGVRQPAQTIYHSWVSEAIAAVSAVNHFNLVAPDFVMPNNGAIAVLGQIKYA